MKTLIASSSVHVPAGQAPAGQAPKGPPAASRKLRILLLVECAGAGTGRHVLDLAEGLVERGHEAHVLYATGRLDERFSRRLASLGGVGSAVVEMKAAPHPRDVRALRRIRRYAREHGPFDVIHGHSSKGGAMARLAALGTPAAAFYTLHGLIMMDPTLPRWKWLMYYAIELGLALRTARIIAVSPEEARAAVGLGFGAARVITIPNGVGAMRLAPRERARAEMGVEPDARVIGFVGRLVEQKAPHVLIEAFARAARAEPRARLAIVGDGPLKQPMMHLAGELGAGGRVIWLGERDARQVFAGFDVFALSSRKEGLPYVVLEAMAAGLPVVATKSAGVEILVEPGISGEVVETNCVEAFAGGLIRLITDDRYRAAASAAALRRAGLFTVDAMVERTIAAYEQVLPGARAG
jgi:glycosyltransferase involved in cell wall biosynthesis